MADELRGRFVKTVFRNAETHYTVARFRLYDDVSERQITVVGHLPVLPKDTLFVLSGDFVFHPKFGRQFQISSYTRQLPSDEDSLIAYLSGPSFPGIGKRFAKRLVTYYGKDLVEKVQNDPDILDEMPNMNKAKKDVLLDGLLNQDDLEQAIAFFSTYGLGIRNIMRLERIYGKEALNKVKENPYRLVVEVDGIGMATADKLALGMGFDLDHPYRKKAFLLSLSLESSVKSGNSFLYLDDLEALYLREFDSGYEEYLQELVRERLLVVEDDRVYHHTQYDAEVTITRFLNRFPQEPLPPVEKELLPGLIAEVEEKIGITYDTIQREAVETFFDKDIMILTGGPGTGKTTVVRGIVTLFQRLYPEHQIALCAPTGRAAKRLSELTQTGATTIHSLLKWDLESNTFGMNAKQPLLLDLLIMDEASMVDPWLFANLLKASAQVKKILLIGDEAQLPPVMPGKLLADLLGCARFPVVTLKRIYRQQEGSGVIELAHAIRNNTPELIEFGSDVSFLEASGTGVNKAILFTVEEALKKWEVGEIQVLAARYGGNSGIDTLNDLLQQLCNPSGAFKKELKHSFFFFREGDKVLQLKNQADDDVYNGDIGTLVEIDASDKNEPRLQVDFDDNIVEYTSEYFSHLRLAYCISVHKSQGSEYPLVIMPFTRDNLFMLDRRMVYTAISRASKKLVLVGNRDVFFQAIATLDKKIRYTTLKERLSGELTGNRYEIRQEEEEYLPEFDL